MAILGLCRLLIHSENSCFLKPKCADLSLRRDQTKTDQVFRYALRRMFFQRWFKDRLITDLSHKIETFKDGLKIASLRIYRIRLN